MTTSNRSPRSPIRRAALVAAGAAAALVLAACGGDSDPGTGAQQSGSPSAPAQSPAGAHNAADTAFAQGMIPHHRQAVEMADLAPERASSAEVKKLATQIKGAQDPEIETMTGWLTAWGEEIPEEMPGGMDHSEHGGMPGMMSADDMEELKGASGTAFDTMFLDMMIEHHEGAVEMAETEKSKGEYAPAKKLADAIVVGQTAEIKQMKALLNER